MTFWEATKRKRVIIGSIDYTTNDYSKVDKRFFDYRQSTFDFVVKIEQYIFYDKRLF